MKPQSRFLRATSSTALFFGGSLSPRRFRTGGRGGPVGAGEGGFIGCGCKNSRGKNAGFTLIEMLVVVVIIATLAAMIVPRFAGRTEEAKSSAAGADIEANLASALDLYELDNGAFPTTEQGLSALRVEPTTPPVPRKWKGPYLKKRGALSDPWGNAYVYLSPGTHGGDYDLSSWGPDGVGGTPDDITNWETEEKK